MLEQQASPNCKMQQLILEKYDSACNLDQTERYKLTRIALIDLLVPYNFKCYIKSQNNDHLLYNASAKSAALLKMTSFGNLSGSFGYFGNNF